MDQKNKRGVNFTPNERTILLRLGNKYKNTLENKKTDGLTWRAKENCWKTIELEFNSSTNGPPRTSKQLKMKYENIKKDIKRKYSQYKNHLNGTGGGKPIPEPTPSTEDEKELTETIALSVEGLKSQYDCDRGGDGVATASVRVTPTEEVECSWTDFHVDMLQTPMHGALQIIVNEEESELETSTPTTAMENQNEGKQWTSRRRPLLKKKCQKSAATQFEELAAKKENLINKLTNLAENTILQNEVEHKLKVSILKKQEEEEDIKLKLLQKELELADIKLNQQKNIQ